MVENEWSFIEIMSLKLIFIYSDKNTRCCKYLRDRLAELIGQINPDVFLLQIFDLANFQFY